MSTALITSLGSRSTLENYGAVLQILAFCDILENRYGINCHVLDYIGINCRGYKDKDVIMGIIYGNGIRGRLRAFLYGNKIRRRYRNNLRFLHSNCNVTDLYDYNRIKSAKFKYDYYIAESDVIWDPTFRGAGFDKTFFLQHSGFKSGKKIVYAAGIGDAIFTESQKEGFLAYLESIDKWSVRERWAKNYIEGFIEERTFAALDPTLLVDDMFYRKWIANKAPVTYKYVLVYSPGYVNERMINDAYMYADENDCKVVLVERVINKKHKNDSHPEMDVVEFLNFLDYSTAFFCDSFHGICLSVMLKKQFVVYERPDGKKIPDICERLGLMNRIVKDSLPTSNINYEKVYENLENERQMSFDFLTDCLKIC